MRNKNKKIIGGLLAFIVIFFLAVRLPARTDAQTSASTFAATSSTAPGAATSGNFSYTPLEKIPGSDTATSSAIDFYAYVQAIYKFGIWAVGIVAMFMIIFGGYTYITSAGNNSQMETAKRIIGDAIIGLIMALTAYLLLYIINPDLVKMKKLTPVAGVGTGTGAGTTAPGAAGTPGGTGKCTPMSSGACSADSLKNTCFSSNADQASSICNKESVGAENALSQTDKCTDGNSFSVGLFQINLTVHDIGAGCTKAFQGTNYNCVVKDPALYQKCVALAQDPTKNTQEACSIYKSGGWNQWGANKGANWNQWGANKGANGCGF